jgi:hypothetical protein
MRRECGRGRKQLQSDVGGDRAALQQAEICELAKLPKATPPCDVAGPGVGFSVRGTWLTVSPPESLTRPLFARGSRTART